MTRDYAKKEPRKARPKTSAPARSKPRGRKPAPAKGATTWQWLLVVAVTSAFVGFVVYLNTVSPAAPPATPLPQASIPETLTPPATAVKTVPKEPEYRFYDLLPKSEVIPPNVEAYDPGGERQQYEYIVQTGSFRARDDAERQKAQIGFLGLRANVSQVSLDNSDVWYRVQIGPYQSRSKMNSVVDRLVAINIQPMVRKIPVESETP